MIQLANGTILSDQSQIKPMARTYQTINVDALIAAIQRRQAEWESVRNGLNTRIPVGDMFEDMASLLADLGVVDAYDRLAIIETNSSEYLRG
jgi:hypothetical protein